MHITNCKCLRHVASRMDDNTKSDKSVSRSLLLSMYDTMVRQRMFEDKVEELYGKGLIPGVAHLYTGQEAVAAGVCAALERNDLVVSNHRGHGHSIARGVPEQTILSELMGKESGMCSGIGGSMHSTDVQSGLIFSTAIVGGGIPLSVGIALALKMSKKANCVVCFFGEGASNTGAFHEGLNLAAVWKLPVLFICENNQYAVSVHVSKSTAARVAQRGQAYGIPSPLVDGMDALAVYETTLQAASRAKRGEGPTLVECETYRYKGHGIYDKGLDYRTREEISQWIVRDPIQRLERKMTMEKLATPEELEDIRNKAKHRLEDATEFSLNSPYPPVEVLSKYV
jgi:TPP-dependent pyruvate/acetoin dehydrogenase alpha subunit